MFSGFKLGKPFKQEIQKFDSTYHSAMTICIDNLKNRVNESTQFPLISTGSGGSLTSALFAVLLHQQTRRMATYSTPLELLSLGDLIPNSSILIITAGGRNYDILNSFRFAAEKEPQSLCVLCATKNSTLKNLAKNYEYAHVFEFELPCGKDGFLATNSLLSFNLLLLRAYENSFGNYYSIPESLESLIHPGLSRDTFLNELRSQFIPLFSRDTFLVLFDRWAKPAAFDLESKFAEAALGNVQAVDYRNFAHGRHNWLAKRGDQTGIIALVTPEDQELADKTIDLIPKEIPVLRLSTNKKPGQLAALDLIAKTMCIVDMIGESKNIDPGRPSVPDFGVRIFRLHVPQRKSLRLPNLSILETAAVVRKLRSLAYRPYDRNMIAFLTRAFRKFIGELETAQYGAIILDYDGTICEPANRYKGVSPEVGELLSSLLEGGIIVGIATGRGRSVRSDLQRIIPQSFWSNVLIGYYNGSDIGFLDDNNCPNKDLDMDHQLASFLEAIRNQEQLIGIANSECRPKQISLEPIDTLPLSELMNSLRNIVEKLGLLGIQILESSHSVDVLAPNVTKLGLVKKVDELVKRHRILAQSLCIGDKGKWPGNDFALLSGQYSLSSDTVSWDPNTCWNLAPLGHRCVQATSDYLKSLEFVEKSLMRFDYSKLKRSEVV